MRKSELNWCIKCGGLTLHEWQVDKDSSPDEPQFSQICLRCEGVDDTLIKELPEGQKTL